MRVVAGTVGGRQIKGPPGAAARPTMDKVRGAIFNSLSSRFEIAGKSVLDLFAGSGAMGIEALSRGAAEATFVEKSRANAGIIRANLDDLGLRGEVEIQDVMTFIRRQHAFDLAFVDPPYEFDNWSSLLRALNAGVAICESDRFIEPTDRWSLLREKRYGRAHVCIFVRESSGNKD